MKLAPLNTPANYNQDSLFSALRRKFGTEGYTGNTVGYYGLLLGHIIYDELKQIDQYGYKATFHYVSIDRMISLDFTTWYGATNVGGWGDEATIYQVRRAYLGDPFDRLSWMIDTPAKHKVLAEIDRQKQRDIIKCSKDAYADAGFLSPLLKYNASKALIDSLRSAGLKNAELYTAFIAGTLRLNVESTVFNHEGRHAIDQLFFKKEFDAMTDDERELRAKYSEVRFSSNPKLAFTGSIFGGDLDVNTNHGKANQRFRKLIVDWMQAHTTEIRGFDKTLPVMIQFDLLSNSQVIEICELADPLSPKNNRSK